MRAYDIISAKKQGRELGEAEIREFIAAFSAGLVPDYQAAALLMAICWRGMSERETYYLTDAMLSSGDRVDLAEFGALAVDKHSTGGVGDKTTLIVAPLAAALGCRVAKMSGRGLGHTGGTVDKLEAFPGYASSLSPESFLEQVRRVGVAVVGQSGSLVPADKKLYALRDVTATVDSVPLIASSVMSKKLAAGAGSIVLDVKCGSGSFMKTPEAARELAAAMVKIGASAGRRCAALVTDMDKPLGRAVGNVIELKEAISVLRGEGPADVEELSVALAAKMASLALNIDFAEAERRAKTALREGSAFAKFKEWIAAQGGDVRYADDVTLFGEAKYSARLLAECDGYVAKMDAEAVGRAAMELGAGRKTKGDAIDGAAGIYLDKKTGDAVQRGDVLATLYTEREETLEAARALLREAYLFGAEAPRPVPLIYETV